MSLNAAAIRSGRLRVVCAADGGRGREVTDEMTVTVECEFRNLSNAYEEEVLNGNIILRNVKLCSIRPSSENFERSRCT